MALRFDWRYFCAFAILLATEVVIATQARGGFVRGWVGDTLVVVLIYCLAKSLVGNAPKLLWLYILAFAVAVEVGQHFDLAERLGLGGNRLAQVILGSTFDPVDIACYSIGCLGIWGFEAVLRKAGRPESTEKP
jgi:hypothetical protein